MGDRIKTNLDEDIHEYVLEEHRKTDRPKSDIVNDLARKGFEGPDTATGFLTLLGQSLFVAGPVVALLSVVAPGVGMMVFGLGLMIYGPMQRYMAQGHSLPKAAKLTLLS